MNSPASRGRNLHAAPLHSVKRFDFSRFYFVQLGRLDDCGTFLNIRANFK
tara:strand:+ start:602 stop:751 length:150 start_codon:yes stop_codon:yes gene_type:complete